MDDSPFSLCYDLHLHFLMSKFRMLFLCRFFFFLSLTNIKQLLEHVNFEIIYPEVELAEKFPLF